MGEPLFNVVFDGALTGEFDKATTAARFARLFNLDAKRTNQLFSGKSYVIKNKVPENVAMDLMIKVSEAGCECYIEEFNDDDIPEYEEKRSAQERRLRFRRPPRPSAIIPDRRLTIRRRKDRRYFNDLHQHGYEIPLSLQPYPLEAGEDLAEAEQD